MPSLTAKQIDGHTYYYARYCQRVVGHRPAGIQETLIVYPRRQGQRHHTTATCLTRMSPLQSRLFSLLDLKRYAPPSR